MQIRQHIGRDIRAGSLDMLHVAGGLHEVATLSIRELGWAACKGCDGLV